MRRTIALIAVAVSALIAGCAPARPVVVTPAPAPPPQRVEVHREAPRPEARRVPERGSVVVTSVYTDPERVRGGDDIELVAVYELDGRRGRETDVTTTFEVRLDGTLASMPTVSESAVPGRYESRVRLFVPEDAPRGWYDVEAYVVTDSGEDVGGTEFRVR